jgi:RimJ/RimL family protein N-acetyltransferase
MPFGLAGGAKLAPHLELRTERLLLRRWRQSDREPFARLNADPVVMRNMLGTLTRMESDAFVDRIENHFDDHGFGLWAVEALGVASFVGFVGLSVPRFEAHFTPAVEVGWRLDRPFWGRGYATEAARASLQDGFERVGLREIVSFTIPTNLQSIAVMERLGMTRDPNDDFEHPGVPRGHPYRRHVLYRIAAP